MDTPGLSILVVDDYPDTASSMADVLKMHGHRARIATSGPEAIRQLVDEPADVVLLDLAMPGMNGYDVATRIRQSIHLRQPVIIVITADGSAMPEQHPDAVRFDHFLTKPVALKELVAKLALIRPAAQTD